MICRNCGKRPSKTSDGFCIRCKKKEVLREKMVNFQRRSKGLNRLLAGGAVE